MILTIQEINDLQKRFHLKLLSEDKGLNKKIKGIKIIENEDMEKYLWGGELVLTSLSVYLKCNISQYEKHIENLIKKGISGFILKDRGNIRNFDFLKNKLIHICNDHKIPVFEIPKEKHYWDIICYILEKTERQDIALLRYHKLTNDNFKEFIFSKNASPQNIIYLLNAMINNPISLYYENNSCLVTTKKEDADLIIKDDIHDLELGILLRYHYQIQKYADYNQYIIPITFIGDINIIIVIDEINKKLTKYDFIAIENGIDTLRYSFTFDFAKNEINKKYHRDIFFNLINSQLNYNDTTAAANMLNLNENEYYRIVSFHSISESQKEKYSIEQLEEVDIIADEISQFYPKEHIYKNISQIVMLQKMNSATEDTESLKRLEELIDIVKVSIKKRNQNTNFNIGVGGIVKGYRNLKESYKQSRIAMKFMNIAKKITGDVNKSIVHYSKIGIFQSFLELNDVDELKKYVPLSIIRLNEYDKKHKTQLLNTLRVYISNNLSINKCSKELCIQYRSVSYRIKKIKNITNINFDDSIELLSLRNGLIIFDIIEEM